jgi:hypothetical protein
VRLVDDDDVGPRQATPLQRLQNLQAFAIAERSGADEVRVAEITPEVKH